jgi:hypothetical protein
MIYELLIYGSFGLQICFHDKNSPGSLNSRQTEMRICWHILLQSSFRALGEYLDLVVPFKLEEKNLFIPNWVKGPVVNPHNVFLYIVSLRIAPFLCQGATLAIPFKN